MKYILVVLFTGIFSFFLREYNSWLLYGWLHYFCGSIITYFSINDYYKYKCEDDDE